MPDVELVHGDCLDKMKLIPNGIIDMVLTSPPYDNLRSYNESLNWGEHIWKPVIEQLFRIIKVGGVVVWIVGDATIKGSETGTSFKQALYFKEIGFNLHDTMIYMKDNPPPVGGDMRYYQAFEFMFVFSKNNPSVFNPIVEDRRNKWNDKRTSRIRPVTRNKSGVFTEKNVKIEGQVKLQNVWSYVVSGGSVAEEMFAHEHPAIYPESMARDHIISWSNEGDMILDPFAGSGTTGKVAKQLKRNCILIEKELDYINIIRKRLNEQ